VLPQVEGGSQNSGVYEGDKVQENLLISCFISSDQLR
jgi:hypothetical protein